VHRLREGLKTNRTAYVNRIRGLLAEFSLVFGKSAKVLKEVLSEVLEDVCNELAALARLAVQRAKEQWAELDAHIRRDRRRQLASFEVAANRPAHNLNESLAP
jgi:transposase